jgi:hypothetical protein
VNADTGLRLALAITPRDLRERRFEEWRADAAGCDELGISRADVARGALRLAVGARTALLLALVGRLLLRCRTFAAGVLLGAVCAVAGIPVLTVVAMTLLLQGGTVAVSRRRSRVRRPRPQRVETGR